MNENMQSELHDQLMVLRKEHRTLDDQILEIEQHGSNDQLQLSRLKRQKLQLKDQIITLEAQILPDIIA